MGETNRTTATVSSDAGVAVRPLALACAALACAAACGPEPAREAPVVLNVGYAAPAEQGVVTGLGQLIDELTLDSLIRAGQDGAVDPLLARTVEVAPDGRRVTVTLREAVDFHDGSRLTAADVKSSLERLRDLPGRVQRNPVLGDIESISVDGEHRITIELSRPSGQLLLFALGLYVDKTGPGDARVGTGPFYVESRTPARTTLRSNTSYFQGRPEIDEVNVITYLTVRAAWTAMMRSEVDFLFNVPVEAREFIEADSTLQVFSRDTPYAYGLLFNTRRPPFDDVRLRVALSHAVDRDEIIGRAFRGHGSVASGVWPGHQVYEGRQATYDYDPRRTVHLLDEIGLPPASEAATGEAPERLRFRALVGVDQSRFETIALLMQRQLRRVGITMEIDARPFAEVDAMLPTGDWDAVLLPINLARNLGRLYLYWHSSQLYAVSGFTGADSALDRLRSSATEVAMRQAAQEVQHALFDQAPAIFLASLEEARAVSRRFVVPDEPGLDVMETLWRWRLVPEAAAAD